MADRPPRLAVLIDADNTSPKVADGLFDEVAKIGEASLRRIYGDFSKGQQAGWERVLQKHAILAQQQFAYTTGKNSTDIALVIDAMDLMHSGRFDGFCLVSSDSDFTRLAARIREQGLDVYGIGQQKTPEAFRQACTRFVFTENFVRERRPGAGQVGAPPDRGGGRADREGAGADGGRRRGLVPARRRRPADAEPVARVRHPHLRPGQAQRPRRRHRPFRDQPRRAARPPAPEARARPPPLSPRLLRWAGLAALSLALVLVLEQTGLPAALLLGPMLAGIVFSVGGAGLRLPILPFSLAQALVGCMIARTLSPAVLEEIARDWPIFAAGVLAVVAAAAGLGWMVARLGVLPGTTAVWGSSPGAASAMTLMSESFGGDMRLVALMQYTRVVIVATVAAVVARFWGAGAAAPPVDWLAAPDWPWLAATLALATGSVLAGRFVRLPAAPLLLPMILGVALQSAGLLEIELPPLLLALAYGAIGWGVGLRFDRAVVRHAARALPAVIASIVCLVRSAPASPPSWSRSPASTR